VNAKHNVPQHDTTTQGSLEAMYGLRYVAPRDGGGTLTALTALTATSERRVRRRGYGSRAISQRAQASYSDYSTGTKR
jgi:hypothetical protein